MTLDFFTVFRFYRKVAKMIQGVSIYLSANPGIVLFCPILSFSLTCAVFYFTLGYSRLTNNVVIVSGEQRRDSAIHILTCVFLKK